MSSSSWILVKSSVLTRSATSLRSALESWELVKAPAPLYFKTSLLPTGLLIITPAILFKATETEASILPAFREKEISVWFKLLSTRF